MTNIVKNFLNGFKKKDTTLLIEKDTTKDSIIKEEKSDKALTPIDLSKIFKQLLTEINWGNIPKITKILNDYPQVLNTTDQTGRTPLIYAITKEKIKIIQLLLDKNCDTEVRDNSGMTALLLSASLANLKICAILLNKGADIKAKDNAGLNVLLHAINSYKAYMEWDANEAFDYDNKYFELLRTFLEKDRSLILEKDSQGNNPIIFATKLKNNFSKKLLEFLEKYYPDPVSGVIQYLTDNGSNDFKSLQYIPEISAIALYSIQNQKKYFVIKISPKLNDYKIDLDLNSAVVSVASPVHNPNNFGQTSVTIALGQGNHDLVKFLLQFLNQYNVNYEVELVDSEDPQNYHLLAYNSTINFSLNNDALGLIENLKMIDGQNINEQSRQQAFILAAESNVIDIVRYFISNKINIDSLDSNKNTALIKASANGYYKVVELLIKEGVNKDLMDKDGVTALMKASANGHDKVVELLIKKEAKKDLTDKKGFTALIWAAEQGNVSSVEVLIRNYVNKNIKDEEGFTALMWAVKNGHSAVVKYLASVKELDPNIQDNYADTPLILAIDNNKVDIVVHLLKFKTLDLNIKNENHDTALLLAIRNKRADIVAHLVKKENIDPNIQDKMGNSPLMLAIKTNQVKIVEYLLSASDIKINQISNNFTPLHFSTYKGYANIVKLLLGNTKIEANKIIGKYGLTPLHIAAYKDNSELVELFVNNKKIKQNEKTGVYGLTALHIAANNNLLNILKILIKSPEIDINAQSYKTKLTSLHISVAKGYTDIVKAIVEHKDTNLLLKDQFSNNALMISVAKCNKNIVGILMGSGAYNKTINGFNSQSLTVYGLSILKKCAVTDPKFNQDFVKKEVGADGTLIIAKELLKKLYDCNTSSVDKFCNKLTKETSISINMLMGLISTYNPNGINDEELNKYKVLQKIEFEDISIDFEETTSIVGEDTI